MIDPRERYAIVPQGVAGADKHTVVDMFAGAVVAEYDTWDEAEAAVSELLA